MRRMSGQGGRKRRWLERGNGLIEEEGGGWDRWLMDGKSGKE